MELTEKQKKKIVKMARKAVADRRLVIYPAAEVEDEILDKILGDAQHDEGIGTLSAPAWELLNLLAESVNEALDEEGWLPRDRA